MDHCVANPCAIVEIGRENYKTEIKADGLSYFADEPNELGGKGAGMNPYSFLLASLGSCTAITLRMYADRKKWDINKIQVTLSADTVKSELQQTTYIKVTIRVEGNISKKQENRLLEIADLCPLHQALQNSIIISTNLLS